MITTSSPRKVIPERTLSYYMLNRSHWERIGLVAHGPVHVAFMCQCVAFGVALVMKSATDHIKGRAKGGFDSIKFDVLTHEMNTHVDVTRSGLDDVP